MGAGLDLLIPILLGVAAVAAVMLGVSFLPAFPKLTQVAHRWIVSVSGVVCVGCLVASAALYFQQIKKEERGPTAMPPRASDSRLSDDVPASDVQAPQPAPSAQPRKPRLPLVTPPANPPSAAPAPAPAPTSADPSLADSAHIYQGGIIVGDVFGGRRVPNDATHFFFQEISHAQPFNLSQPFEYRGIWLRMEHADSVTQVDGGRPQDGRIVRELAAIVQPNP